MHVVDSSLNLSASRQAREYHEERESLTVWTRDGSRETQTDEGGTGRLKVLAQAMRREFQSVELNISSSARRLQPQQRLAEVETESPGGETELQFSMLRQLVERFTGRAIRLFDPSELEPKSDTSDTGADGEQTAAAEGEQGVGWGLVYDYYESHYESEQVSFSAEGVVRTADGQEISIDIDLNMSREFYSETQFSLRVGDALKDPLVINFSGTAAELTQEKYSFDIDADGSEDQISFVTAGSGFLALDENGDGEVNDGSELFGALSGDGFAELAVYDEDGNGWIDEADDVFSRLRIWSKDAEGNDQLVALAKRGVGAIYLGNLGTQFSLNDTDNQQLGQIRSTGLFLGEEGGAGTVQQLDLVV